MMQTRRTFFRSLVSGFLAIPAALKVRFTQHDAPDSRAHLFCRPAQPGEKSTLTTMVDQKLTPADFAKLAEGESTIQPHQRRFYSTPEYRQAVNELFSETDMEGYLKKFHRDN
jgi:hypothetical protein